MQNDESGASEVIGALMLILIVVGAAASFATFVQQQQDVVQENRLQETRRENEDLTITGANFTLDAQHQVLNATVILKNTWSEPTTLDDMAVGVNFLRAGILNYTVSSGHFQINISAETGCTVTSRQVIARGADIVGGTTATGDFVCRWADSTDFSDITTELSRNTLKRIHLEPGQQVVVSFNQTLASGHVYHVETAKGTFPVPVSLKTRLGNTFERTFEPPTPYLVFTNDATTGEPVADARQSEVPDGYRTLLSWTFEPTSIEGTDFTGIGDYEGDPGPGGACGGPVSDDDECCYFQAGDDTVLFDSLRFIIKDAQLIQQFESDDTAGHDDCKSLNIAYDVTLEVTASTGLVGIATSTYLHETAAP